MEYLNVIGLMSGTSLDGVDLVYVNFSNTNKGWSFNVECGKTYKYAPEWKNILQNIKYSTPSFEYLKIDQEYGIYLGNLINEFIKEYSITPSLICSHGHTIFHQPSKGITCQIGNGNNISAVTGLPVVYDLRSKDVALGGHGAPLVPFGDLHLFPGFKYCLNLGGFANVSIKRNHEIFAFDICPANIILNSIVADMGLDYDHNGELGKTGEVNHVLLKALNNLDYYQHNGPKSLGKEWLEEVFIPTLYLFDIPIEHKLRTIYTHIAEQISYAIDNDHEKMLITGGGAHNEFLIYLLQNKLNQELILPEDEIIDFKEAIIFAFLGAKRMNKEINVFSSVTGSSKDNSSGIVSF